MNVTLQYIHFHVTFLRRIALFEIVKMLSNLLFGWYSQGTELPMWCSCTKEFITSESKVSFGLPARPQIYLNKQTDISSHLVPIVTIWDQLAG